VSGTKAELLERLRGLPSIDEIREIEQGSDDAPERDKP
jgi:hypothetical protein